MSELLSPGGNLEKIKFAVHYGADAVYCALKKFGLRSQAGNLTKDDYLKALNFVHENNKKLYLTLNAYLFDEDFNQLFEIVDFLNEYPPDGVIVSDLGVLSVVSKNTNIPVHMSTQANITNSYAANMLKNFNVKRIVLARELTLDDIKEFKKNTDIELEAFVHGAMCMSYSGRCFISSYLTGRSANRGDCTQSCRWKYTVIEHKRPDMPIDVEEHPEGTFIFNSYDMCALPILPQLIENGVSSLKIEGRMKSLYYVSVVTSVYRDALNTLEKGGDFKSNIPYYLKELGKVSHRPYSFGFYLGQPKQHIKSSGYIKNCDFCGVVLGFSNGYAKIQVRGKIENGEYELVSPTLKIEKFFIDALFDHEGNVKKYGNPNEFVYIRVPREVEKLSLLRKCSEGNSRKIEV